MKILGIAILVFLSLFLVLLIQTFLSGPFQIAFVVAIALITYFISTRTKQIRSEYISTLKHDVPLSNVEGNPVVTLDTLRQEIKFEDIQEIVEGEPEELAKRDATWAEGMRLYRAFGTESANKNVRPIDEFSSDVINSAIGHYNPVLAVHSKNGQYRFVLLVDGVTPDVKKYIDEAQTHNVSVIELDHENKGDFQKRMFILVLVLVIVVVPLAVIIGLSLMGLLK